MTLAATDTRSRATLTAARYAKVPRGLYAVTVACGPETTGGSETLVADVERAIKGGACMVQYRDKSASHKQRRERAAALCMLCADYRIPMIVNDDVNLTREVRAGGVHLGEGDIPIAQARAILGEHAIIGVSCYNDFSRALKAWQAGADYIAFGSYFPSPNKPGAVRATLDLLERAHAALPIPICAIGGIASTNAAPLIHAGAGLVAIISGVFAQIDPEAAAREIATLFRT
ncbi:MAG: thiamine phosphate synthase [Gammaproteobacteria bacterium]